MLQKFGIKSGHPTLGHRATIRCQSESSGFGIENDSKYDAIKLDHVYNKQRYKSIAESCCHRVLISGSVGVDGLYERTDQIDAVFRTDLLLYHKFENMVFVPSGNLYIATL